MGNYETAFPSKFLKATDIGESAPIVTIANVVQESVGQNKDVRFVAYFEGKQKGCVLNKTNCKAVAAIANSNDTDDWVGVKVQLFVAHVEFQGETVEAIRIRAPKAKVAPKPKPVEPEPDADDDADPVPF